MYSGSSAITSQERSRLVSPDIKVTLRANAVHELGSKFDDVTMVNSAFTFRDNVFIFGVTDVDGSRTILQKWDLEGSTKYSTVSFPADTNNPNYLGDFVAEGNTLHLFYTTGSTIHRISTGGTNWGASEVVLGVSSIHGLAAVGSTELYILFGVDGTAGVTQAFNSGSFYAPVVIRKLSKTSSWGVSTIYNSKIWVNNYVANPQSLMARRSDDIDTLLITASTEPFNGTGLQVIRTDGRNILGNKFMYSEVPNSYSKIKSAGLAIGASVGIIGFMPVDVSFAVQAGVTRNTELYGLRSYITTQNYWDWSSSKFLLGTSYTSSPDLSGVGSVFTGITNNLLLGWIGGSSSINSLSYEEMNSYVIKDPLEIDISENISSYTNTSNERVSLNLGNYQ